MAKNISLVDETELSTYHSYQTARVGSGGAAAYGGGAASGLEAFYPNERPRYSLTAQTQQALQDAADFAQTKPDDYKSAYAAQIDAVLDGILAKSDFAYDPLDDARFRRYQSAYTAAGDAAMRDTVGQVSRLSGGYGNSYAATAGNLTYRTYLSAIQEQVPVLYQAALQRSAAAQDRLYEQLSVLRTLDESDYARWHDAYTQYYAQLQRLSERADDMQKRDYDAYVQQLASWQAERELFGQLYEKSVAAAYHSGGAQSAGAEQDGFDRDAYNNACAQAISWAPSSSRQQVETRLRAKAKRGELGTREYNAVANSLLPHLVYGKG